MDHIGSTFPSLTERSKAPSVTLTLRLPITLARRIEAFCKLHGVNQSALVRDFINNGLTELSDRDALVQDEKKLKLNNPLNPFEDLAGTWIFGPADEYIRDLRKES